MEPEALLPGRIALLTRGFLVLACAGVLAASGCGDDDEPEPRAATATATQTATEQQQTGANEDCSEVAGIPTTSGPPTPDACEVALLVARLYQAGERGEAQLCAQLVPAVAAQQRTCREFVAATKRTGSPLQSLEFTDSEASVDAHYRDDPAVRRFYAVAVDGSRRIDLVRSQRQQ